MIINNICGLHLLIAWSNDGKTIHQDLGKANYRIKISPDDTRNNGEND